MSPTKGEIWSRIDFFLKHRLGWIIIGGNFLGVSACVIYFMAFERGVSLSRMRMSLVFTMLFFAVSVAIGMIITTRWQGAIITFVRSMRLKEPVPEKLVVKVQRKMLNLPLFSARLSLVIWMFAAIIMPVVNMNGGHGPDILSANIYPALRIFLGVFISGIITTAVIYFATESRTRSYLPHFFPDGGLVHLKGAFSLKLRRRTLVTFFLASLLPMTLLAVLSYNKAKSMLELPPSEVIQSLYYMTAFLLLVAIAQALILSLHFTASIIRPVLRMEKAMGQVARGDLTVAVPVTTNDELGILSDHFNRMVAGLRERYHMRRSLALAAEIQQKLLPQSIPTLKGFDIFGAITYCDETGGDYYDYIVMGDDARKNGLAITVGDVTGHGIPSALLMASARAALRQRAVASDDPALMIADVNRQLARDIADEGHFITLFMAVIDPAQKIVRWVNAGHDPALLYQPQTDRFEELGGHHLPLGVMDNARYESFTTAFDAGQVMVIGTDGIWESQNQNREMFGKKRLKDLIRKNAAQPAETCVAEIVAAVKEFCGRQPISDDITIVVIKKGRL